MLNQIIAFLGRRGEFFYISVFMLLIFFLDHRYGAQKYESRLATCL